MSIFASIEDRFDRSLFIVNGYMHDNGKRDFLLDLIRMIATYYHRSDTWCSKDKGQGMRILEGSNGVKVHKDNNDEPKFEYVCCTEVILKGKCEWRIRVNKLNYPSKDYWHIVVGVINTNKTDMKLISENDAALEGCYTFDVTIGRVIHQRDIQEQFERKVTKAGDTIDITLDLENKKVGCKINGTDIGKSIEEIEDGEYRLLVGMYFGNTELELL